MIGLIICLVILPYFYGSIFLNKNNKTLFLRIPVGLIMELVVWAVVSLPTELLGGTVSFAIHLFSACNIFIIGYGTYRVIRWTQTKRKDDISIIQYSTCLKKMILIFMLGIVLYQALRATFFQYGYGDDRVYVAMVNDMVETDAFYPYVDETGSWQDMEDVPKKYLLSSWYTFETMLAKTSGIKPLMLIYTLLPGYLILMMYIIWWYIAETFFHDYPEGKAGFIIILAILFEFNAEDVSSYVLNWPTYGKNITASFVMPLFLLFWIYSRRDRCFKYDSYMWVLMLAGCAASTMGLMMMPIEATLLTGIEMYRQKCVDLHGVVRWLLFLVPVLIYALLFMR